MSDLIGSWILRSASVFNLLSYHMLCSLWKTPWSACERRGRKTNDSVVLDFANLSFDYQLRVSLVLSLLPPVPPPTPLHHFEANR